MIRVLNDKQSEDFIRANFKKGDVLRWESYKGSDKIKDRFFVLLTPCIKDSFLTVTATSQVQYYVSNGRRADRRDVVFIYVGECDQFPKDTVLDFTWQTNFSVQEMAKLLGVGITRTGYVNQEILKKINTCVEKSSLISKINKKKILGN